MSDYKITFTVDGRVVPEKEILEMELSRYHHVFRIFDKKNIPVYLDNKELILAELLQLPLERAKIALAQTREALGKERTLELFAPEIEQGDNMWHEIGNTSRAGGNFQEAYVEVETENITLEQFMLFNQSLMKKIIFICLPRFIQNIIILMQIIKVNKLLSKHLECTKNLLIWT